MIVKLLLLVTSLAQPIAFEPVTLEYSRKFLTMEDCAPVRDDPAVAETAVGAVSELLGNVGEVKLELACKELESDSLYFDTLQAILQTMNAQGGIAGAGRAVQENRNR